MKVAHVCNYAPGLSGMYGTVRDLILSEKKIPNITAEFIDDAMMLKDEYGKDGITPVPIKWGDQADIIVWHHAMVEDWYNEPHRNLVLFLHGTPEFNLFTELYDNQRTLSLLMGLAKKSIPRAYISMWKRHIPIWENLLQKKIHYVPSWTDVQSWSMTKRKTKSNTIKIALMDFWRVSREPFGIIQAIEYLRKNTDKKIEVDVWGITGEMSKTWLAVCQWLIEDNIMVLRGRSSDVQKDIYDKSDMIMTMSTEETRVVREAYSAGVPIISGRAKMGFTKYSEDCINPGILAGAVKRCHSDLCSGGPKLRKELRAYAEKNFSADAAATKVIKIFKDVIKKHGSINHPLGTKLVMGINETADRIKEQLEAGQPIAHVTFGEEELRTIGNGKGRVAALLRKAFKYQDKTRNYYVASAAGITSEGRMRSYLFGPTENDDELVKIMNKHKSRKILDNAMALPYKSVFEPTWFVDMLRKCVHGKRVMFIGKEAACSSAIVKAAFDVDTFMVMSEDKIYKHIGDNWTSIEAKARLHDIIICADLGIYTSIIAYNLWVKGFRTTFLDIGLIADAMSGLDDRSWTKLVSEDFVSNYEIAFLPTRSDIIMVTHGQEKATEQCIESIKSGTNNYRVLWVDNGSGEESMDIVKKSAIGLEGCEIITNKTNEGYAKATNKAIKKSFIDCAADWVVLLGNDVVVTKNWLLHLISAAVTNDMDVICPVMSSGSTSVDVLRSAITDLPTFSTESTEERAKMLNSQFGTKVVDIVSCPLSCCAMRRELIEQIGLFDEELFVVGVDDDYFHRILRLGKKVGVALGSYVSHDSSVTISSMGEGWLQRQKQLSSKHLSSKWKFIKK